MLKVTETEKKQLTQIEINERKGLKFGMISNFLAGSSGVAIFFIIGATSMLLDGAFSIIGFASSILAIVIAYKSGAKSNEKTPTGAYVYENLFLLFRTFFLISYLSITGLTALINIVRNHSAALPATVLGGIMTEHFLIGYSAAMFTLHLLLLGNNWRLNKQIGGRSQLLKVESRSALIDFLITLGAVAALVISIIVQPGDNQLLAYFKDQADNYIVVIIVVVLLIEPLKQFRVEMARLAGRRVDKTTEGEIFDTMEKCLKSLELCSNFSLNDIYLVQRGKVSDVHISVAYTDKKSIEELDCIRDHIEKELAKFVPDSAIHIEWSGKKIHEIHK